MIRLVVFDLDGTLVDSQKDIADAANALITHLGGSPLGEKEIAAMVGEGAALLVRRALAAGGLDPATPGALEAFLHAYDERLLQHTRPYAGMLETLGALQGSHRIAVLTNKPTHATARILRALQFERLISGVIAGDTPAGRKPDPAGLRQLMSAAEVDADTTLLVGDSPIDLETARRARVHVCLARYGFGYRFTGDEFRGDEFFIDSPGALVDVIDAIDRM